tara:strand:+ start:598 stop:933 length:336 start_codon:yes stop_codon:yes gene_type:complete
MKGFICGAVLALVSLGAISQEITVVPQHANGMRLTQAYLFANPKTQMLSFCQNTPYTAENKHITGNLVTCITLSEAAVEQAVELCLGSDTPEGPALLCGQAVQDMLTATPL